MSTETRKNRAFTYLEFGAINPSMGEKDVYDFRVEDKAYDWLMHARYSNDIFVYKQMTDALLALNLEKVVSLFEHEVHHDNDFIFNLNKKIALELTKGSFFELGQTLFGCIDTIEFINALEKYLLPDHESAIFLKNIDWFGVDISPFFNFMSEKMHYEYKINTSSVLSERPNNYDVFFAKGITLLYAINSAKELFDVVSGAKITVFDYSISLSEQEDTYIGTGKAVRYLGKIEFDSFYKLIRESGKDIWVRGNSKSDVKANRLYIEGVITDNKMAKVFIEKQNAWILNLKNKCPTLYQALIHEKSPEYWTWSMLSDFL